MGALPATEESVLNDPTLRGDDAQPVTDTAASTRTSDLAEIRNVQDRLAFATDAGDWQTFLACFVDGATGDYGALGSGPIGAIVDAIAESQGRYLGTMNFVGTHEADWNVDHALARTYVISHHFRAEGESQADDHVGTRYADRLVKQDGLWKVVHREARVLWFRQDVVHGGWI